LADLSNNAAKQQQQRFADGAAKQQNSRGIPWCSKAVVTVDKVANEAVIVAAAIV